MRFPLSPPLAARSADLRAAIHRICRSAERPSRVVLPVRAE